MTSCLKSVNLEADPVDCEIIFIMDHIYIQGNSKDPHIQYGVTRKVISLSQIIRSKIIQV